MFIKYLKRIGMFGSVVIHAIERVQEKEQKMQNEDIRRCNRCHRLLKDEVSKARGFGNICYQKYLQSKKCYLFTIEEMERLNEVIKQK